MACTGRKAAAKIGRRGAVRGAPIQPVTRRLLHAGYLLAGLAAGTFLVAWSGAYNVAASAGHWPPTAWLLGFVMRNSVASHAAAVAAPPRADPALVQLGAAHYRSGCMACHGAPGEPRNPIVRNMLPEPPYLPQVIGRWGPEELFWIVRHGLKYTGMPAWPAPQRDDEVWAVVAFLERLAGLDPAAFRRLSLGAPESDDAAEVPLPLAEEGGGMAALCARCHGVDGAGRDGGAPRLAGQSAAYLYRTLQDYAVGARPSGIMQPIAAELGEAEMRELAAYYSEFDTPPPQAAPSGAAAIAQGREVAVAGVPGQEVPPCAGCHGAGSGPVNPLYPDLAGQHAGYIVGQLRLWQRGARGSTPYAEIMAAAARGLDEAQMRAVAGYYAGLGAAPVAERR